ncbi:MAG: efflux RND transporter permease subunit [Fodinibius sp.]|nr:efflux RND transporter permease subunit [Fodinibius sp.]
MLSPWPGVVVNNAIVMIDYIDILRTRDNMPFYEALVQGGKVRFRPVILTALTTTLGLVPLAIGFNLDFITLVNSPAVFFGNIGNIFTGAASRPPGGDRWPWPLSTVLIFATSLDVVWCRCSTISLKRAREV